MIIQLVVEKQNRRLYTRLTDTIGIIQRVFNVTEQSLLTSRQSNEAEVQKQNRIKQRPSVETEVVNSGSIQYTVLNTEWIWQVAKN